MKPPFNPVRPGEALDGFNFLHHLIVHVNFIEGQRVSSPRGVKRPYPGCRLDEHKEVPLWVIAGGVRQPKMIPSRSKRYPSIFAEKAFEERLEEPHIDLYFRVEAS